MYHTKLQSQTHPHSKRSLSPPCYSYHLHYLPQLQISQMNQYSFSIPIKNFSQSKYLSILTVLFLLPKTYLSVIDTQFQACVPKTCGDSKTNISYPFWIDDLQQSYCGYPGFKVSCNNNGHPIVNISNNTYIIQNIFYQSQSFRLVNAEFFYRTNSCFPPLQNLTDLGNRYSFPFGNSGLFLYPNCSSSLPENLASYKVNCSDDDGTGSGLAVFVQDPNLDSVSKICRSGVKVPVELYGDEGNGIGEDWEYYVEVLRRGFVLNWIAGSCSECETSGGRCGFDEDDYHFKCYCPDRPHAARCAPRKNKLSLILAIVIPGAGILIICVLIFLCRKKWKAASSKLVSRNISVHSSKSDLERGSVYFGVLPIFSYSELEEATNNFDSNEELGDGGFGTVYYGKLRDGREVAVKRLYENNCKRVEQFMNEVKILAVLRHKNLVSLYGCTSRHSRELLLVYEFIPNGTVADHLHGDQPKPGSLSWPIRMSIAIETATALAYLHASDIIHRDVKTNNILLDNNFCVKVADFGLSRLFPMDVTHVSTAPQGTPGYLDPDYHQCYQLTDKSDVYSFGVVLIELISSLPAVDISRHRHEINLADLAINKIQNCAFSELIDSSLGFERDLVVRRMTTRVAELAFRCLQHDKDMRPSMDEVCDILKGIESENYEVEETEEVENIDVEVLEKSTKSLPSRDSDDVGLLKNMQLPHSPNTVTEKWVSRSTTPNTVLEKSTRSLPTPDSDDVGLLKNMQLPHSPNTVTEKWVSTSTTPNPSA